VTSTVSAPARYAALAAILSCAFAVRAAHVAAILHSPAGDALVQDARAYHGEALRLAGLAPGSRDGPSFLNLGYPYALAAVYGIAGPRVGAMLFLQALLGAISCVLLALTARSLFDDDPAAMIAGFAYALYRPAVFYDGLLLTPSLAGFAVVSSLWAAVGAARSPRHHIVLAVAAGGAVGAGALVRPNILLLAPVLAVAAAGLSAAPARRRIASAVLLGTLTVILPVTIAQRAGHGTWVPLSANGGMNFWTGNHSGADGAYSQAAFVDEQSAAGEEAGFLDEARRRTGRATMTLADSSTYWLGEGLRDIRSDPTRWLGLLGRKLLLFGSRLEIRTNVSSGFAQRLSPALRLVPVAFPILFAAGIAGLAALVAAKRLDEALVVGSTVLVAAATCALFFVAGEYRHLAAPGLALGAGSLVARPLAGVRRAIPLAVSALALVWSLTYAPADLAGGSGAAIDFSNFARAICMDGLKSGDVIAATNRADALLDLAPADLAKRAYVLDARLWVRTLATRDGTRESYVRARDAAAALTAALPEIDSGSYSDEFRDRVRSTLSERLRVLALSPHASRD